MNVVPIHKKLIKQPRSGLKNYKLVYLLCAISEVMEMFTHTRKTQSLGEDEAAVRRPFWIPNKFFALQIS